MLPLKKILCPTDFSDPSFEALDAASELAEHFSCELIVVHVVPPVPVMATGHMSPATFNVHQYQEEMERSSKKELEDTIAKRVPKGISARGMVLVGNSGDQIVDTAEDENADLIVIATHGQTGLKRVVFGSVAEKVVRLATRPVLSIREPLTAS
jgi:nucleotide-binding universal stress UspA family protein